MSWPRTDGRRDGQTVAEQGELGFGELLRQLRNHVGLTQEELAAAAQVSQRAISDLERGVNHTARRVTAELLADALDLAEPARAAFVAAARGRARAAAAAMAAERQVEQASWTAVRGVHG